MPRPAALSQSIVLQAYPKAYIAVAENSGAHTMSQLHRLDPVYLSVDCKNFLDNSRGPSTLLPAPLIDPTGDRAAVGASVDSWCKQGGLRSMPRSLQTCWSKQ